MLTKFKQSKFFIGICLISQAMTFLALAIICIIKKKNIWTVLLSLSGVAGGIGAYLIALDSVEIMNDIDSTDSTENYRDYLHNFLKKDFSGTLPSERKPVDIPMDETADETEFT